MKTVLHLFRIVLAYLLSAALAGLALQIFTILWDDSFFQTFTFEGHAGIFKSTTLEVGLFTVMMISIFASAPAAAFVALAEWFGWRKWWAYAGVACTVGVLLSAIFGLAVQFLFSGVLIGLPVGLLYWTVAGRYAGVDDISQRKIVVAMLGMVLIIAFFLTFSALFGYSFW